MAGNFTIPALSAGNATTATDLFESYQGASPSVKVTGQQIGDGLLGGDLTYPSVSLVSSGSAALSGTSALLRAATDAAVTINNSGVITIAPKSGENLVFAGCPSTDPHVVGAIFGNVTDGLKISAG
jgi:hypothetical protein